LNIPGITYLEFLRTECTCTKNLNKEHKNVAQYEEAFSLFMVGPFEKFVDWRQCAAVMQREAVTYAKL
jgi:hypothetical protein